MRCEASHKCGGSNLEAKRKRLRIVFATLLATKQGADRAECKRSVEAIGCDYATGAEVTERTGGASPSPTETVVQISKMHKRRNTFVYNVFRLFNTVLFISFGVVGLAK